MMNRRRKALRRTWVLGAALAAMVSGQPATAHADVAGRYEQYRYAVETSNLTYSQYVARQQDFRAAGCGSADARSCRKPSPYRSFDWTDDGCSGRSQIGPVSLIYRDLFNRPCRQHDFGYRNLLGGLSLHRHEDMRAHIDRRFLQEMNRLCEVQFSGLRRAANRVACRRQAAVMFALVRNIPSNRVGTAGTPPPRPAPARPTAPAPAPPAAAPPGSAVPPSAPPPPPAPATYAQTVGGPTSTWTDYRSAGGHAGARIATGTTVAVSCKLTGFAVSNGNTWWYRIASAPWDNAYYASADAFYNNGRTSGSLAGTPYVDVNVPSC